MSSISDVRGQMLDQMQAFKVASQAPNLLATIGGNGSADGFASALQSAVQAVDARQHHASQSMAAVDSGRSDDLAAAMIAGQKASISFSALLQVRNKLVSAFDDIMRMPL